MNCKLSSQTGYEIVCDKRSPPPSNCLNKELGNYHYFVLHHFQSTTVQETCIRHSQKQRPNFRHLLYEGFQDRRDLWCTHVIPTHSLYPPNKCASPFVRIHYTKVTDLEFLLQQPVLNLQTSSSKNKCIRHIKKIPELNYL